MKKCHKFRLRVWTSLYRFVLTLSNSPEGTDRTRSPWTDLTIMQRPCKALNVCVGASQTVDIDLLNGVVRGYSGVIHFLSSPTPSETGTCDSQAVIRLDFSQQYKYARFKLEYDKSRLWTLDISDSETGDGYGGDNGTTSNMAETQIYNKQLRIYSNSLPGYQDATIDGNLLLKVADNVVKSDNVVEIEIGDEKVEWTSGGIKQTIMSPFLYTVDGQNTSHGEIDQVVYAGFNRVVSGSFRTGSGLCKVTVTMETDSEDQCSSGEHDCDEDADCFNTRRSFRCKCKPGFYGTGKRCEDEMECEFYNGGCVHHCANTRGSYTCSCLDGFELAADNHNCIDKNECLENRGGCEHQCINTLGHYECKCNDGYSLAPDGKSCQVGTWCPDKLGCQHYCQSSPSTKCACRKGFRLHPNGRDCIQTCAIGNGGCQHKCEDKADGVTCSCHIRYKLSRDGKTCVATCQVNNGGCSRRCDDTEKGPRCSCPMGYKLLQDKKTCQDVDECLLNAGGCSHECMNTRGSYECLCPQGYTVDEDMKTCKDVNECHLNTTCDHICVNTPGSFTCHCKTGYELYGETHCADTDECSISNGLCSHTCENNEGSHHCSCNEGYKIHSNKKDCVDINSCLSFRPPANTDMECSRRGYSHICTLKCSIDRRYMYTVTCGPETGYTWASDQTSSHVAMCSNSVEAPVYKRKASFIFFAQHCKLRKRAVDDFRDTFVQIMTDRNRYNCIDKCEVKSVNLKCDTRRRKFREMALKTKKKLITMEFEMKINPNTPNNNCDVECSRTRTKKRLKKTLKILRKSVNNESFYVRFEGVDYPVLKKSLKTSKTQEECGLGTVLVDDTCIACSTGTYFDLQEGTCKPCTAGTYQDKEGQVSCAPCPQLSVGIEGAQSVEDCQALCPPGHYSETGIKPCHPCPRGQYQPQYGRLSCVSCGLGVTTSNLGSTGFQHCQVSEYCQPGHLFDRDTRRCTECPLHTYQPLGGQDNCIKCPGNTTSDFTGTISSTQCKDRTCGGHLGLHQGFIRSPNWPGPYPTNAECTWTIRPQKGRRILIVIPDIYLVSEDKCGDELVMRKTSSPYSLTTFQTCETLSKPVAFTARSKKLWIRFKSNQNTSARGFSIPYVTFNEEYQELIEDIVRDSRLYSLHQHQRVLKDERLLSALLEVIAQPYTYFKYANESKTMFPESFIKLLRNKVLRFFDDK